MGATERAGVGGSGAEDLGRAWEVHQARMGRSGARGERARDPLDRLSAIHGRWSRQADGWTDCRSCASIVCVDRAVVCVPSFVPSFEPSKPPQHIAVMRVIFLDVDGVINSAKRNHLCLDKLEHLVNACKVTESRVVISSHWRLVQPLHSQLNAVLRHLGIEVHPPLSP